MGKQQWHAIGGNTYITERLWNCAKSVLSSAEIELNCKRLFVVAFTCSIRRTIVTHIS